MCGIVGYIGDKLAHPVFLDGLRQLEYRGYDSAGIAVYDTVYDNGIIVDSKALGQVKNLAALLLVRRYRVLLVSDTLVGRHTVALQ